MYSSDEVSRETPILQYPCGTMSSVPGEETTTIAELLLSIAEGTTRDACQQLRRITDSKEQREFKSSRLPAVAINSRAIPRNQKNIQDYTGYCYIDLDDIGEQHVEAARHEAHQHTNACAVWVSCSGTGLGLLYQLARKPTTIADFKAAWEACAQDASHVSAVDQSTCDPVKLTFISHDPDLLQRDDFEAVQWEHPTPKTHESNGRINSHKPDQTESETWVKAKGNWQPLAEQEIDERLARCIDPKDYNQWLGFCAQVVGAYMVAGLSASEAIARVHAWVTTHSPNEEHTSLEKFTKRFNANTKLNPAILKQRAEQWGCGLLIRMSSNWGGKREGAGRPKGSIGEHPPQTHAERQETYREKTRQTLQEQVTEECARLIGEHANHFCHLNEQHPTTYIRDQQGFWHPILTAGGQRVLLALLKPELKTYKTVQEIGATLNLQDAGEKRRLHDFNQRAVLVCPDAVLDCSTREPLDEQEIHGALLTARQAAGFNYYDTPTKAGQEALEKLFTTFDGDRPFRYLLHHRLTPSKHIPIIEARLSDQGKTSLFTLHKETWGDAVPITLDIFNAKGFNMLELYRSQYGELLLDEADKKTFTADKLNAATNVGEAIVNPKMEKPRPVILRGTLILATAGPLGGDQFDWEAQGILPDQNGYGGRLRDLCRLTNAPIQRAYGRFLNRPEERTQRQPLITALGHHLLSTSPLWPKEDQQQAEKDFADHQQWTTARAEKRPAWQNVLLDRIEKKPGSTLSAAQIRNLIAQHGETPPKTQAPHLSDFMLSAFESKKFKGDYLEVAPKS